MSKTQTPPQPERDEDGRIISNADLPPDALRLPPVLNRRPYDKRS